MREALTGEWGILQQQYEDYEKYALLIKIVAVMAAVVAQVSDIAVLFTLGVLGILWIQEGVIRTLQSRAEARILVIESALANDVANTTIAMQFHTNFALSRPSTIGLVNDYGRHALRPTVALVYVSLIILQLVVLGFTL